MTDEPVLTIGHRWPDGGEAVDAHRAHNGWRVLLHWPHDDTINAPRVHPWSVCTATWYPERGWVRHSSEAWLYTRHEAEQVFNPVHVA